MDFDEMEIRKKKTKQIQNFNEQNLLLLDKHKLMSERVTIDWSYSFTDYLYGEYIHSSNVSV